MDLDLDFGLILIWVWVGFGLIWVGFGLDFGPLELSHFLHFLGVLVIIIRFETTFGQVLDWVESHVRS